MKGKDKNNWDEVSTNYCLNIKLQCEGLRDMFSHNQNVYQKISERIKLSSGICGAIIATIGLVTISNLSMIINIIIALLGLAVTILSVFSSVWKVDENLTNSYAACTNFDHIVAEITFQFTLKPSERINCNEFKKYILEKYRATKGNAPIITDSLKDYLKKKSGHSYVALYEQTDVLENTDSSSSDVLTVSSETIINIDRIKSEALNKPNNILTQDNEDIRARANSEPSKLICPNNFPNDKKVEIRVFSHKHLQIRDQSPSNINMFVPITHKNSKLHVHALTNIHNNLDINKNNNFVENVRHTPTYFSIETTI